MFDKLQISYKIRASNVQMMIVNLSPIITKSDVLGYATSLKHVFTNGNRFTTRMQQEFQEVGMQIFLTKMNHCRFL